MAFFVFSPQSLNWHKPFMSAEWSLRTAADGVYVLERLVGIGARQCGPMSTAEAQRFVADRRLYIGQLQRAITG